MPSNAKEQVFVEKTAIRDSELIQFNGICVRLEAREGGGWNEGIGGRGSLN